MSIFDHFKSDDPDQPARLGRRTLLATGATIGAALVAAACGDDDADTATTSGGTTGSPDTTAGAGTSAAPVTSAAVETTSEAVETTEPTEDTEPTETTAAEGGGDLAIAQLAAGLEVLAVATYQQAADAAGSGALGDVPPAVGEYVATALAHHEAHLEAWNTVITDGGGDEVTEPNADLAPVVAEMFAAVTDVAGAAMLALELEDIAAQTYLSAIPVLESPEAIQLAGSIQIVDQQHQAILLFALGQYPVPEVFQKTDKAVAA